ncbi:MAG: hypothetical protein ACXWRE_07075, partial [Pseudobdellovibrionaceae bacterium]
MKNFIFIVLSFALMACQTIDRSSPVIRRDVKDQSFAGKSDNTQPRKRLLVLPFLDASEKRPEYLREKARTAF